MVKIVINEEIGRKRVSENKQKRRKINKIMFKNVEIVDFFSFLFALLCSEM